MASQFNSTPSEDRVMGKNDWELVGVGPLDAGAVWRCWQVSGWLYALWNVEAKLWTMTFVPAPPPL